MSQVTNLEGRAWADALERIGGVGARNAVVVGGPAHDVIDALVMVGGPTARIVEVTDWSALPSGGGSGDEVVGERTVDMVLLLRAWNDRRHLDRAARLGRRWLREGGTLVLGDLDVERLVSSVPRQYPSSLLYRTHPGIAAALRSRSLSPAELEAAMIRAAMDDKRVAAFDRPIGVHDDPSAMRRTASAWRGMEMLTAEERSGLLSGVGALLGQQWPLVETEPWIVVAGKTRF